MTDQERRQAQIDGLQIALEIAKKCEAERMTTCERLTRQETSRRGDLAAVFAKASEARRILDAIQREINARKLR